MKSYTDMEQSHKLAEFLPLESADMHHKVIRSTNESKTLLIPYSRLGHYKDNDFQYCIPCWSLAALLGVLPESYQLTSNKEGKVQLMLIQHLEKDYYDNPIDACYEMILKLNELNLL